MPVALLFYIWKGMDSERQARRDRLIKWGARLTELDAHFHRILPGHELPVMRKVQKQDIIDMSKCIYDGLFQTSDIDGIIDNYIRQLGVQISRESLISAKTLEVVNFLCILKRKIYEFLKIYFKLSNNNMFTGDEHQPYKAIKDKYTAVVNTHQYDLITFLTTFISVKRDINEASSLSLRSLLLIPFEEKDENINKYMKESRSPYTEIISSHPLVFCANGKQLAEFTNTYLILQYKVHMHDEAIINFDKAINSELTNRLSVTIDDDSTFRDDWETLDGSIKDLITILYEYDEQRDSKESTVNFVAENVMHVYAAYRFLSVLPEFKVDYDSFNTLLAEYLWCIYEEGANITRTIVREYLMFACIRFATMHTLEEFQQTKPNMDLTILLLKKIKSTNELNVDTLIEHAIKSYAANTILTDLFYLYELYEIYDETDIGTTAEMEGTTASINDVQKLLINNENIDLTELKDYYDDFASEHKTATSIASNYVQYKLSKLHEDSKLPPTVQKTAAQTAAQNAVEDILRDCPPEEGCSSTTFQRIVRIYNFAVKRNAGIADLYKDKHYGRDFETAFTGGRKPFVTLYGIIMLAIRAYTRQ